MLCFIDPEKHTFSQSCSSKELTEPVDQPECPPGWTPKTWKTDTAVTGSGGGNSAGSSCSFQGCDPMPITSTSSPTTPTTIYATGQSTTPSTTLPPFEHIGNGGCPEGFMLEHNNGSLFFDCPYRDYTGTGGASCGVSCDEYGNCTTTCSNSPEDNCQDALTSGTILNFRYGL